MVEEANRGKSMVAEADRGNQGIGHVIYLIILILILLHLIFFDVEGDPHGKVKVMPLLYAHRYI